MSNLSEQFDPFQEYPNVSFRHIPTPGGTGWRELDNDPDGRRLWTDSYGGDGPPLFDYHGISTTVGELTVGGTVDTDFTGWGRSEGGLKIPVLGTHWAPGSGSSSDLYDFNPITEMTGVGLGEGTPAEWGVQNWKLPNMNINVKHPPASRGSVPQTSVSSSGLYSVGSTWTERGWVEDYGTEIRGERGIAKTRRSPTRAVGGGPHPSLRVGLHHDWEVDPPFQNSHSVGRFEGPSLPEAITDHHTFFLRELENYRSELYNSSEFPSEFYEQFPD